MTAYRFRIKSQRAAEPFWRDIEIGADRTLAELGETIIDTVGLEGEHLWYFGTDQDYWASPVKYLCHREYESLSSGGAIWWDEDVFDATETTVRTLGLDEFDRVCYLFDYVNDRRFYGIVTAVLDDADRNTPATVTTERGQLEFDPAEEMPSGHWTF